MRPSSICHFIFVDIVQLMVLLMLTAAVAAAGADVHDAADQLASNDYTAAAEVAIAATTASQITTFSSPSPAGLSSCSFYCRNLL